MRVVAQRWILLDRIVPLWRESVVVMLERFLDRYPGLRDPAVRRYALIALLGVFGGSIAIGFIVSAALGRAGVEVSPVQVMTGVLVLLLITVVGDAADAPPAPDPRKERIARLTSALEQASELVDELRRDITEGEELASRAQADAERYERLRALKREEVEAVAQEFGSQIRSGDRRNIVISFATNVVTGAVFFALGLLVG
jgi:hypothetical protein